MKHLIAFYGSLANSLTNTALTPVSDTLLGTRGSTLVAPENLIFRRAFGFGATLTEARINVPSMRAITLPRLYPVEKASAVSNNPPILDWNDFGPTVLAGEGIGIDATTTTGGSNPDATYGLLWVGRPLEQAPVGPVYTMKATAAAALSAGVWVNATPTMEQDLPAGRYAIIGCDAYGTGLVAARFAFPGQLMRPGILCQQAAGEFDQGEQRFGKLGKFGEFTNIALPTMDFLGATGTAQTIYMDLVKIG